MPSTTKDLLPKEKPATPEQHHLRSGMLQCLYENGFIRYIRSGKQELVRSVYPAVRDQSWQTAPMRIVDEKVLQTPEGFTITYTGHFALNDLRYNARISISSSHGEDLVISFDGTAESDFLRNRIGLCALLPVSDNRGRPCIVGHPDGSNTHTVFPETIQPVQPFLDISRFDFETTDGTIVNMVFSGDIFEAEDQRNWGDASLKIYSTPHHLPLPVAVLKGHRVQQEIRIRFPRSTPATVPVAPHPTILFQTGMETVPFPGIGYCYSAAAGIPDAATVRLLRRLNPDHYRVEIFLSGDWQNKWNREAETATQLGTRILLSLYFEEAELKQALPVFFAEAAKRPGLIAGVLLFRGPGPLSTTGAGNSVREAFATGLPGLSIGSGTDSFFAHWNQQPQIPARPGDFVSIPVSPQVHQPDTLTMIENLPAMSDIVETIRSHGPAPVFIGPVTLKPRYNPDSKGTDGRPIRFPYATDPRQHSLLAAAWTALALRYLGRADRLSLFELTGERGILPDTVPVDGQAAKRVYPVYVLLREIAAFKPKKILLSRSGLPLSVDGLELENSEGEKLMIFCNFTRTMQTVRIQSKSWKSPALFAKTLSDKNLEEMLEEGEKFRSAPYEPFSLTEANGFRLGEGALLFLTTLQHWSFS